MQRVGIVGLGLIGGSIGKGLLQWAKSEGVSTGGKPALEVIGFDQSLDHQGYAKKIDAVNRAEWDIAKAIRDADVVIVATPVISMKELFADIGPMLKQGAVVLDVGSTKEHVMLWAAEFLPTHVSFVGTHPMAGKTQSIEGADAELFKGATWCVCPSTTASEAAIRTVLGIITALGAEPYFVDPVEHDAYVAGISHLPFVLSTVLMNAVSSDSSWRDMRFLTAGGFKDVSRLAAGSPEMHRDILLTNRKAVTRWLDASIAELGEIRGKLNETDETAVPYLTDYFTKARDSRADWSTQVKKSGDLVQDTQSELLRDGLSDQMGRMLFGGFSRRRGGPRKPPTTGTPKRP